MTLFALLLSLHEPRSAFITTFQEYNFTLDPHVCGWAPASWDFVSQKTQAESMRAHSPFLANHSLYI
jgi:hypothetical protein